MTARTATRGLEAGRAAALLLGVAAWVTLLGAGPATGQDPSDRPSETRAEASSPVQVQAQGGTGDTAPEYGAPPPPEVSREVRPARIRFDALRGLTAQSDTGRGASLHAVALSDDEATVELDGRRQVVRPGSRLGDDIVKSISPGRLVLIRPAKPEDPGGEALVIVTFDPEGRGRSQVFWTRDPTAPVAPEVKTP